MLYAFLLQLFWTILQCNYTACERGDTKGFSNRKTITKGHRHTLHTFYKSYLPTSLTPAKFCCTQFARMWWAFPMKSKLQHALLEFMQKHRCACTSYYKLLLTINTLNKLSYYNGMFRLFRNQHHSEDYPLQKIFCMVCQAITFPADIEGQDGCCYI